jgi:WhiB family redox-sensing transcriptional regulator
VRRECLVFAFDKGMKYGVWGGTTEHERRVLRRRAAAAGSAR